jgi:hypothetical protein
MYIMPFTVLETAMNSLDTEIPWYKMLKKGVSRKLVKCIKGMCDEMQFCIIWSYGEVTEPVEQTTGVRQRCSHSPYLLIYLYTILCLLLLKKMHKHQ